MNKLIITALFFLIVTPSFAAGTPNTEEQKTLYALGQMMGHQISIFNLTPNELEFVKEGLTAAITGKPSVVDIDTYGPMVQQLAQTRNKALEEKQIIIGKEFIDKAAKEKGAVKTESGLVYLSLKEGSGAIPSATDTVKVHYRGTLIDGKEFDSSYQRNEPIEFELDGVIKCWSEGVQKMKVGGKAKLVCPSSIAYGEKGVDDIIPPGATLVFEVELLDIKK
ncbi:MAG: FKBP-type peptidyl-prolyl cis-trans isomerase [Oryzomonas sp.]|jgi:FKBP-type peptidyl-prolyl cis-trans isomerase FkpA